MQHGKSLSEDVGKGKGKQKEKEAEMGDAIQGRQQSCLCASWMVLQSLGLAALDTGNDVLSQSLALLCMIQRAYIQVIEEFLLHCLILAY